MKLDQAKQALNYYRLGLEEEDASDELKQEMRLNEIAAYEMSGDMESAKSKLKSYIQDYPDDERAAKGSGISGDKIKAEGKRACLRRRKGKKESSW